MKKIVALLLILLAFTTCIFTACDNPIALEGEYKHVDPNDETKFYGIKVVVKVDENVITSVEIVSQDTDSYRNVVESQEWAQNHLWNYYKEEFVSSFVGKTVEEILAVTVECNPDGMPRHVADIVAIGGATQSCGRIILAVKDALSKLQTASN